MQTKISSLKKWVMVAFGIGSVFCSTSTQAQTIQFFGFQTDNPAALQFIQGNEIQLGGVWVSPHLEQKGTIPSGAYGTADSHHDITVVFPQFRFAHRFSPKLVASLDVSEPILGRYPWKMDSFFVSTGGTSITLDSLSFIPKLSYAVTDNFTLGAAFVATDIYNYQFGFLTPIGYFQAEDGQGWGFSYQLGAMYKINPQTFIDLTYISKIKADLDMRTFVGSSYTSRTRVTDMTWQPDTLALKMIRFMTQKWLTVLEVDYSNWSELKKQTVKNTALGGATIGFAWDTDDVWRFHAFNQYQFKEKLAGFIDLSYETKPWDADTNYVIFPATGLGIVTVGLTYNFTDAMKMSGFIGDGFWPSRAKSGVPAGSDVKTSANWYFAGFNFTYDWK